MLVEGEANPGLQLMAEPAKKRATYADVLAAPPHVVAEIIDGVLETHPRPSPRHGLPRFAWRRTDQSLPERSRRPGGWMFIVEPELHLGRDVLVPDLAGWRRERLSV